MIYSVVDFALRGSRAYQKYLIVLVFLGGTWGYLFYPYLVEPKYLYTTPIIQDYRAIRDAMKELEKDGISKPTVGQIASVVSHNSSKSVQTHMASTDEQARVTEILPYFRNYDVMLLVYRPVWWACMVMSAICVLVILVLIFYQYLADPPTGAYVEKILWCMLLYCSFEVLHHYAFTQVKTFEL